MTDTSFKLVLRFCAPDQPGIVAAITPLLASWGCDIREAHIYGDLETGKFFVRMALVSSVGRNALAESIAPVAAELDLDWELFDLADRPRLLVAVSQSSHCLVDLIHKWKIGHLPVDIVGVVSNHDTMRSLVEWHSLPYRCLPADADKASNEAVLLTLVEETQADLVVLARYMQILSGAVVTQVAGRCINIHHSFLPSFRGARPYHQAHSRGVKLIGATAHYVTVELDEGPIIEQDVRRVTHAASAEEMVAIGREVEASVLSRAVRWHAEHRVFLNGNKTVVLG